jgi:hypothetical protein
VIHLEPNMLLQESHARVARLRREADVVRHVATARAGSSAGGRPPTGAWQRALARLGVNASRPPRPVRRHAAAIPRRPGAGSDLDRRWRGTSERW